MVLSLFCLGKGQTKLKKWMQERDHKKKLDQIALKAKKFKRERMYRAEAAVHVRWHTAL